MKFLWLLLWLSACSGQGELKYVESAATGVKHAGLIVLLHGYGSSEADLFTLAPELGSGMHIVSLRAPLSLPRGGYAWFQLDFSPGKPISYDFAKVVSARKQVISFISRFCKSHRLDSNNVFIVGFSQGGMMAYDLALAYPARFRGCVALGGVLLPESKSPAPKPGGSFFIGHGTYDDVIPLSYANDAYDYLKTGAKVAFHQYPIRHAIAPGEVSDVRNWIASFRK